MPGKLYLPEVQKNSEKKHPCSDCYSCQHCSDERCDLCLKRCHTCGGENALDEKKKEKTE